MLLLGSSLILVSASVETFLPQARDLWTCASLDCNACIALADRQHCSLNNQEGVCCTRTDTRGPCNANFRNCSGAAGFNRTNNFNFLVCGIENNTCGGNPDPLLANDPELDPRFKANSNFIVARGNPITITTSPGFNNNKRCTYVIKKTFSKVGLVFEIMQNLNVEVHYFKGGPSFNDLR